MKLRLPCLVLLLVCAAGALALAAGSSLTTTRSTSRSTTTTTPSTTPVGATTQHAQHGPDTVMLGELVALYQPVPFDHKMHAEMADMWDGCTTCHHKTPATQPSTQSTSQPANLLATHFDHKDQSQAAKVPACKSCHEVKAEKADIHMPTLKGAYHRQCLNCHRDWASENACNICHEPIEGLASKEQPTPDDIVGKMHPPIAEPEVKVYRTRFTPAMGGNVMFRHKEHASAFGLKCVNCHRHDSCASCHSAKTTDAENAGPRPLNPGRSWKDTHGPCASCHQQDRCETCHYSDEQRPPAPFDHRFTGQLLDKDHANLKCGQCHGLLKVNRQVGCGEPSCHAKSTAAGKTIEFPMLRPGPVAATQPAATSQASTRPVVEIENGPNGTVKRVRRPAPPK